MDEKSFRSGHSYVYVTVMKEHRALCRKKNRSFSKTKYLWLKNPENWHDKDKSRYAVLSKSQLAVGRAWNRKEIFRDFWSLTTINEAEVFLGVGISRQPIPV